MNLQELWLQVEPVLFQVAYAIIIFVVGWIVSKWVHGLCHRQLSAQNVDEALARFVSSIARYLTLAAAVIVALGTVGIETTSLVALLGAAGLAIGLALQGSLANFAAGVMILFFRPFTLDERVTAGGHTGKVIDIGLFATTMLTPDNERIIIPNGQVTGDSIVNHSCEGTLRGNIEVGVAYGSEISEVIPVLLSACRRIETVLEEPAPAVVFNGFGASSIDFVVRPWAETSTFFPMLHNVRVAIYDDLNAAGIDIPFDQIVVHQAEADADPA